MAGMARYAAETNFALPLRGFDKFVPFGILKPLQVVDRMVEMSMAWSAKPLGPLGFVRSAKSRAIAA